LSAYFAKTKKEMSHNVQVQATHGTCHTEFNDGVRSGGLCSR
jgi:hypothetical protein